MKVKFNLTCRTSLISGLTTALYTSACLDAGPNARSKLNVFVVADSVVGLSLITTAKKKYKNLICDYKKWVMWENFKPQVLLNFRKNLGYQSTLPSFVPCVSTIEQER